MKRNTTETLFKLCKQQLLEILEAVQAGHPIDEEVSHALVELREDFSKAAHLQGELFNVPLADTALVTIQAAVALRKVCKRMGYTEVPPHLAKLYWGVLAPVLSPPHLN